MILYPKWLQRDSTPQLLTSKTNTQPFIQLASLANVWMLIYKLTGCGLESSIAVT